MQECRDARFAPGKIRIILDTGRLEGAQGEVRFLNGGDEAPEDEDRLAQRKSGNLWGYESDVKEGSRQADQSELDELRTQ